jgi:hypothetical protein
MRNAEDAKSRESLSVEPQLQRLENPLSINALNALRDGASCSDTMGCGGYVGFRGARVKAPPHKIRLAHASAATDLRMRSPVACSRPPMSLKNSTMDDGPTLDPQDEA